MTKRLDETTERAARAEARALEAGAGATGPYPSATRITRPNLRLADEQFTELQEPAREHHLPMSTTARSWLLERLDQERRAS